MPAETVATLKTALPTATAPGTASPYTFACLAEVMRV
jgi:hypothetical protein